jgi:hypothetical protein
MTKSFTQAMVLRDFPLSHDGLTVEMQREGSVITLDASLFPGLKDAGCLADPPAAEPQQEQQEPQQVDIPADWREQHHMKIVALAKKIVPDVANKDEAIFVIETELKRREA